MAVVGVGALLATQPEDDSVVSTEEAIVLDDAAAGLAFATSGNAERSNHGSAGQATDGQMDLGGVDSEAPIGDGSGGNATAANGTAEGDNDSVGVDEGKPEAALADGWASSSSSSDNTSVDGSGVADGHLSSVLAYGGASGLSTTAENSAEDSTGDASRQTTTTVEQTTTADPSTTTSESTADVPSETSVIDSKNTGKKNGDRKTNRGNSSTVPAKKQSENSDKKPATGQDKKPAATDTDTETGTNTGTEQGTKQGKEQQSSTTKPGRRAKPADKPTTTEAEQTETAGSATTTTVLSSAAADSTTTTIGVSVSSTTVQDVVTTLSTLVTTTLLEEITTTTAPPTSQAPTTAASTTSSSTTSAPSTTTSTPPSNSGGSGACQAGSGTGVFRTVGTDILDPCGALFVGGGFNAAYNMFEFPYVYQGTDNGVYDVWLDDPNNGGYYPGGGVSSGEVWDPTTSSRVDLPDRYYAINGSNTPGVVQPDNHWNQKFLRINLVSQGEGGSPSVSETLSTAIPDIYEGINYGVVQMIEAHDLTGQNVTATGAWNAAGSSFSGSFGNVVRLMDGLVDEFGIGNAGGSSARQEGYVWFNPTNEPWGNSHVNGCPPSAFFDTQTFWIERIRNYHNAENVIVIDASEWGQDLRAMAKGCYDSWWQSLKNHSSGDLTRNVVMSWHAYGSRIDGGYEGYTYATMDADLAATTAKFPLIVGEYGEPAGSGVDFAGPYQWNQAAVSLLLTDSSGPALADKYNLLMGVWHATGDSSYGHIFKVVRGPAAQTLDGKATPFWDIESGSDSRLENLGRHHWNYSHRNG